MSEEAQKSDFVLPIGKAHVERSGTDVTLVCYSRMVGVCLEAAEELAQKHSISCEVLNLRTLRPLDVESLVTSVRKTSRVVSVEEGWPQCGIGSEIAALLMEYAFDDLDAPMERVTGADVPMPYAQNLEDAAMVQTENVINAVRRVCFRQK